jgi:hypothetical protein
LNSFIWGAIKTFVEQGEKYTKLLLEKRKDAKKKRRKNNEAEQHVDAIFFIGRANRTTENENHLVQFLHRGEPQLLLVALGVCYGFYWGFITVMK